MADSVARPLALALVAMFLLTGVPSAGGYDLHESNNITGNSFHLYGGTTHSIGQKFLMTNPQFTYANMNRIAVWMDTTDTSGTVCLRFSQTGGSVTDSCKAATAIPSSPGYVEFTFSPTVSFNPTQYVEFYLDWTGSCQTCMRAYYTPSDSYRTGDSQSAKLTKENGNPFIWPGEDTIFWSYLDHSPIMATDPATGIGSSSATLNGRNVEDSGTIANVYYQYGTTTGYGQQTSTTTCPQGSGGCARSVSGLAPSTLYHFRICGGNGVGGGSAVQCGVDMTFTTGAAPGPSNDAFASATAIGGYAYTALQSTAGATTQGSEQAPCGGIGSTVWFKLTALHSGTARVTTWGSDFDTVLAAYDGSSITSPLIACNDDTGGLQSRLEFTCVAGREYRIQVGGYQAATGNLRFQSTGCTDFRVDPFVATPSDPYCVSSTTPKRFQVLYVHPNDAPDLYGQRVQRIREQVREMNGFLRQDAAMQGRTADYRVQCTGGVIDVENVFVDIPTTGDLVGALKSHTPSYQDPDVKYIVWFEKRENCGLGYATGDSGYPSGNDQFSVSNPLNGGTGGGPTWSVIDCDDSAHGSAVMMHEVGHAMGAVKGSAPHHDGGGHCTDKRSMMCDQDPDTPAPVCATLRYDCGFDDYFNMNPPPRNPDNTANYLFNHWNQGHKYNKFLEFTPGPANDDFANRATIASAPSTQAVSTSFASHEASGPPSSYGTEPSTPACGNQSNTVWYSYTPAAAGTLTVTTTGSSFDTTLAVFTGTTLENLVLQQCNNNDPSGGSTSRVSFAAAAGTTYHVQAGGSNGAAGSLQLQLTLTGAQGIPYSQAFDGGSATGWTLSGLWHTTTCRSQTPSYSLGYNNAGCPTSFNTGAANSGTAVTPSLSLPAGSNPSLTWQSWHQTESGTSYDRKTVSISTNGGSTWTQLWQEDGTQSAWNARSVSLAAYAGNTVQIRFQFDSVDSIDNGGEGWYVDSVSVAVVTVPSAPQSPSASPGPGGGQITVAWSAPSSNGGGAITGYNVYRSTTSGGTYALVGTVGGTTLSYTDSGLGNGATRYYRVTASNSAGEGPQSATASATTWNPPGAPTGLDAAPGTAIGQNRITWSAPASNGGTAVTGYQLFRATASGGPFSQIASPTGTSHTDSGLMVGTTYWYYAKAVNAAGAGPQSNTDCSKPFPNPLGLC